MTTRTAELDTQPSPARRRAGSTKSSPPTQTDVAARLPNGDTSENLADSPKGETHSNDGVKVMAKKWYAVQTYSQSEKRAKANLQERIKLKGFEDRFGEVLVPTEQVTDARVGGKSRTREQCSFPGYIFVEMELNEETWHLVKDTAKVMGFVGGPGGKDPIEVKSSQIAELRKGITEGTVKPKPRVTFGPGDEVQVTDGPFSNFTGIVEEVKPEKQKVRVKVSIFGRSTPVELDFSQVEKKRA